mmetsp:Transcript_10645/g.19298  ORF Transcript_10645/g.19298 Transcript_10645/m.19298 type:complete len:118 (+) Transcript_10645:190-543(+)
MSFKCFASVVKELWLSAVALYLVRRWWRTIAFGWHCSGYLWSPATESKRQVQPNQRLNEKQDSRGNKADSQPNQLRHGFSARRHSSCPPFFAPHEKGLGTSKKPVFRLAAMFKSKLM